MDSKSVIIHFSIICIVYGLDIKDIQEMDCLKPPPGVAKNIDFEWMLSVPRWYIPIQGKLNFYRLASTLLETPIGNVTENEVVNPSKACITFKWGYVPNGPKLFGFGDKTVTYTTTNVIENTYGFVNRNFKGDIRGRHYMTKRDNESFVFFTTCWGDAKDGLASWSVISTTPTITDELKAEILEHAWSYGFKEEFLLETDYSKCPEIVEDVEESHKNEL